MRSWAYVLACRSVLHVALDSSSSCETHSAQRVYEGEWKTVLVLLVISLSDRLAEPAIGCLFKNNAI